MKKFLLALIVSLVLTCGVALAESLPSDVPVTYGQPEMDTASEDAPQLDESSVSEDDRSALPEVTQDAVRPGDKPQTNSFTIRAVSSINFPFPDAPGEVNMTNPEGSTVITQYLLRISLAELLRQTGRTGYTDEQLQALQSQEGFDPETTYIELAETKGIAPGSMVRTMTLAALPDGSTLPAGDYKAQMVVASFDAKTMKRGMVNGLANITFHILNDAATIAFDASGHGEYSAFNPATTEGDIIYAVQISQQALVDGCGAAHQTEGTLALQQADPAFDPAFEFITLYESEPVAPGAYSDKNMTLTPLPDGEALPEGTYTAWLVRLVHNEDLDLWQILDARTQLTLIVGKKAGDSASD